MKYKSVNAILYPDKILISTCDITVSGIRIPTDKTTWLPEKISNKELGKTVKKYLKQSVQQVPDNFSSRALSYIYAKATGLKTRKLQMENAKQVSIFEVDKRIMIMPTENKGSSGYNSGYHNLLWEEILCDKKTTNEKLGELIWECWKKCK